MPTVRELVEWLQIKYGPEDFVAYDLRNVNDVADRAVQMGIKLSSGQEIQVLETLQANKNAQVGFNWDMLDTCIHEVVGTYRAKK